MKFNCVTAKCVASFFGMGGVNIKSTSGSLGVD